MSHAMKMPEPEPRSWKAEVEVTGEEGSWHANQLRFDTKDNAETYAKDLFSRWMAVKQWRAVPCDDEPNHINGKPKD